MVEKKNKKKKWTIWGIIIFVILALGSCNIFGDDEEQKETEVEEQEQLEAEKKKAEEEEQRQAEEEAQRKAEEERQAAEEEAQRIADEEAQQKAAQEAQRKAEEEASRAKQQNQQTVTESFKNCTEMRKVYPNGVDSSHPAYESKHDRDGDNRACEQ